jgi:hypothetical protein
MPRYRFNYKISNYTPSAMLDTQNLFDKNYREPPGISPLKMFFQKTIALNSLANEEMPEQLLNLLVLGYVSAVESYLREIIRKLVYYDNPSKKQCENKSLTYGAAISYKAEMLPEALLENISFASKEKIKDSLNNFLKISLNQSEDPYLEDILEDFSKVCQIRHCIVHRFGHLGSKNAIEFGLEQHEEFLGKPLKLNFQALQEILLICNNTVKILNNFLFRKVLIRTVEEDHYKWSWNFEGDEEEFTKYFYIFSSDESHVTIKNAYEAFKGACSGTTGSR